MMRRLALLSSVFALSLVVGAVVLAVLSIRDGGTPSLLDLFVGVPSVIALTVLGYLIITRRPGNVIGPGYSVVAVMLGIVTFVESYLRYGIDISPGSLPYVQFAVWVSEVIFALAIVPLITFLFLYCPDGRLPSPRWRPVAIGIAANLTVWTVGAMLAPFEARPEIENPFRIAALGELPEWLVYASYVGLVPSIGLSAFAMVQRFRRSTGIERLQLKWFASAAVAALGLFVLSWAIAPFLESDDIWVVAFAGSVVLVIVATGIAVLRYRLYNIDLLINRTLVYAPLTAILAGLFVAVTGLLRAVLTNVTEAGSDTAIAVSTLAVVALLTPVKNQLQAFVDRRFKQQHDPQDALKQLVGEARSVAQVMDRDRFIGNVLEEVMAAFELSGASVQLTEDHGSLLKSVGTVGDTSPLTVPLAYSDRPVGTLSVWIQPDGEADTQHLIESLEAPAEALAQVISLVPDGAAWSTAARRAVGVDY